MIAAFAERLQSCQSERKFWSAHREAENRFTPIEIEGLMAMATGLPPASQEWLAGLPVLGDGGWTPQRYQRSAIHENIDLYRDPSIAACGKRLIVAFCGSAQRLMMPIGSVLQLIPSPGFDVLLLRDPSRNHFLNGCGSFAGDPLELSRRISDIAVEAGYNRIYCYGTSMGALAALRCGILMEAHRAVGVGGELPWHIDRLMNPSSAAIPAFDPLCACIARPRTELVCAYALESAPERQTATRLSQFFPIRHMGYPGLQDHNIIAALWGSGGLQTFYDIVFDIDRSRARSA